MLKRLKTRVGEWLGRGDKSKGRLRAGRHGGRLRTVQHVFEFLEARWVLDAGPLVISEFMASNNTILADVDGQYSDWIEIYNPSDATVNLDGWCLTDDAASLTKWRFPAVSLSANSYLTVFASGKNRVNPAAQLHTNFQLDAGGEYLALVRPDGTTIAHEYAPQYPPQLADLSYGITQQAEEFSFPTDTAVKYHVPSSGDAAAETAWREAEFDTSGWASFFQGSGIQITECGTATPDYVEIQNTSAKAINTSGWVVAVNNGLSGSINAVQETVWRLPAQMNKDEILYRVDDTADAAHYFGGDIPWATSGKGWAMILSNQGNVTDFVVWGYSTTEIASLDVTIEGFQVTSAGIWAGAAAPINNGLRKTLQRSGNADHNNAADWSFVEPHTRGLLNANLSTPFIGSTAVGIGYSVGATALDGAIQVDVEADMHDHNASLWTRIPIDIHSPSALAELQLRVKYNDGFVAYLNGHEVARRNAPEAVHWESSATATRSIAESLVYEEIDILGARDWLRSGTNILAIHGLNASAGDDTALVLAELSGSSRQYFQVPTPGKANQAGFVDFVADTKFSVDRGFFSSPFSVTLTANTPGATIRYTTDGSAPTETKGSVYTGPITINKTTTLRAAAFKSYYRPSNVDTQTYIFLDGVIRQDGAGFPATWGTYVYDYPAGTPVPANYKMDQRVVNDSRYQNTIKNDLRSIPTLSIVADVKDLWDPQTGIYSHPTMEGVAWERPVSVELIGTDGQSKFQVNAGMRIHGGWGRRANINVKHSLRLLFKGDYGPTTLDYPIFGASAVGEFDSLVLRAGFNDSWAAGNGGGVTYLNDRWAAETHNAMGGYSSHGTFVHLYINGLYWGLYNPVERPNAAFAASYFGGDKEEYDTLHIGEVIDGDATAWNTMMNVVRASPLNYAAVEQIIDIPEFIDYMIVNQFGGNWDWPWNNWYATRRRTPDGKWRFHCFDAEGCLWDVNANKMNDAGGPADIYLALRQNTEFKMAFADRIQRSFLNGGALTPESNIARLNAMVASIDRAIVGESARWGDGRLDQGALMTRDSNWVPRINDLRNNYFPQRTNIVLQQYRSAGLFPSINAPTLNRFGGDIDPGFQLVLSNPNGSGTIYYTLDGSDPRLPGGTIRPGTLTYGGPVTLVGSTHVKARILDGSQWSAVSDAEFFLGAAALIGKLAISEINYHPSAATAAELAVNPAFTAEDFEFIELQNTSSQTISLSGTELTAGVRFNFTGNYQAPPRLAVSEVGTGSTDFVEIQNVSGAAIETTGWVVVVNDGTSINQLVSTRWQLPASIAANQVLYRTDNAADNYWGGDIPWLTNGRGWVMIVDVAGNVADYVAWGYTATEIGDLSVSVNSRTITALGTWNGSGIASAGTLSNSLQRRGNSDHNSSADWAFSSPSSKGLRNSGLSVPFVGHENELGPGDYVVVASNALAFRTRYGNAANLVGTYTGKLDNKGERLTLSDRYQRPIVDFRYDTDGAWPGRADGKGSSLELAATSAVPKVEPQQAEYLQDGRHWQSSSEFGGTPGYAGAGPVASVVINEVLTHTDLPLVDTIELFNPTPSAINLGGWYLSDSSGDYLKYRIPSGTVITAGGYLVFDEFDFNPNPLTPGPGSFALDGAHGDDVWLMKADASGKLTTFIDHVEFRAARNGESLGRWPNGTGSLYPMQSRTLDPAQGQNSGPRVGPVIISEVQYYPSAANANDLEYVEICNPTGEPVDLTNWRLSGGVEYSFVRDTVLGPYRTLVVVPFDVFEAAKLASFRNYYGINASVSLVGGYSGQLSDAGEAVRLERPDEPPLDDPLFIPRTLEDQVTYSAAWIANTAGGGQTLNRLGAGLWGDAASSWAGSLPTPGRVPILPTTHVTGRHVLYNRSVFDGNDAGVGAADDGAIATDKEALLPGQTATFRNYTSYSRGINGIMVDVFGLVNPGQLSTADFVFRVGNSDDWSLWQAAPTPSRIEVRTGGGNEQADRITIAWPDGAIENQWLQVTVQANARTGLSEPDVFYFGNAVGETGDSATDAKVNAIDVLAARNHPHHFLNPAPIDCAYDFNRDALVNAFDMLLARNHQTGLSDSLRLLTVLDGGQVKGAGAKARVVEAVVETAEDNEMLAAAEALGWLSSGEVGDLQSRQAGAKSRTVKEALVDRLLAML